MKNCEDCPNISIIVPVYNVAKIIEECIESILSQTYTDWELILVDDGSPDRSGEICESYAAMDSRIRFFHKENGGASSARNLGIDNARGEWIVFVDGDDIISPDYLSHISQNVNHDFLVFGMAVDMYYTDGRLAESASKSISMRYVTDCKYVKDNFACIFHSLNMDSSCAKAYKKSIIDQNDIRFNPEMICYEDFDFVIRYLSCCNGSFCSLPYIAYHYIQSTDYNPILRRGNKDLAPSIFTLLDNLYNWIKPTDLNEENRKAYFYLIASKYGLILDQLKLKKYKDARYILSAISHNDLFKKYHNQIISHSQFFKRIVLKINKPGFRPLAYLLNKF